MISFPSDTWMRCSKLKKILVK